MTQDISFTGKIIENKEGTYIIESSDGKRLELQLGENPKKYFTSLKVNSEYYILYDADTKLINFVKLSEPKKSETKPKEEKIPQTDVSIKKNVQLEPVKKGESVFDILSKVECNIEKKGRFNYVSWVEAWKGIKKRFPNSNFKVYENESGYPAFIHPKFGGFVKVGVTINDIEYIENFPILDNMNKTIPSDKITAFDINTSIKRGMAKAIALHGLGIWVYAGEDLPEL